MVAATIAATNAAPREQEGLASALLAAAQQLGFALSYAVLSGVASSATARYTTSHQSAGLQTLAQAQVHGYSSAFLVAAGIAIGCAVFALLHIRWRQDERLALTPNPGTTPFPPRRFPNEGSRRGRATSARTTREPRRHADGLVALFVALFPPTGRGRE
jgi:MFS family permease